MTILCRPRLRDWRSRFLKTYAAARPSLSAVSAVTGSTLAVPRTPSVPNIFLGELMVFYPAEVERSRPLWAGQHSQALPRAGRKLPPADANPVPARYPSD